MPNSANTQSTSAGARNRATDGLQHSPVSRRNVLGVAGIGVAAAAAGGAAARLATRQDGASQHTAATTAAMTGPAGPVVVYVKDLGSGDLEILAGTGQKRIHDTSLAAQIARAAE